MRPHPPSYSSPFTNAFPLFSAIPGLRVRRGVLLSGCTRFAVGGPADVFVETDDLKALVAAVRICRAQALPHYLIGEGSNLVASDDGYRGIILRLTARTLRSNGGRVFVDAGVSLQALIDYTLDAGLSGLESLAGIPGSVGAAIYGNAGAYGHSISESLRVVRFLDGENARQLEQVDCRFEYRDSRFKQHKNWFILDAELELKPGVAIELRKRADEIIRIRNEKFPPTLKCAGSIFKNLLVTDLSPAEKERIPPQTIREGKVPAAYFLEQVGAKGIRRGRIGVTPHHANILYNEGGGSAAELRSLIQELKALVGARFGIQLEEEIQYLGFPQTAD